MNITTIIYHYLGGSNYVIRQEKQMKILNIEKEKAVIFCAYYIILCLEIPNDSIKNIKTNKRLVQ